MIDLHCHSTCSDGTLRPAELVCLALREGLDALALTDHDTLAGLPEFLAAAQGTPLRAVPGVEVSVQFPKGEMHILGYWIEDIRSGFNEMLAKIRGGREISNREILVKLAALDMPLGYEEVAVLAGGDVMGRPHIARAMQARGYVLNRQQAFDRYLGYGQPAYAGRLHYRPEEVFECIHAAGGVAVLAHPVFLGLGIKPLTALMEELAASGLDGIEAYYPEHTPSQQRRFEALGRRLGLIPTGGSDFHGGLTPYVRLGRNRGETLQTPDDTVDRLAACASTYKLRTTEALAKPPSAVLQAQYSEASSPHSESEARGAV